MRIKDLFTVPEGQAVTERIFGKVLLSSVCSIALCMACLISTTWAWFTVSVENNGNLIQIGTPEVRLSVDSQPFTAGAQLPAGEHKVSIEHANEVDDLQQKGVLYVTLTMDETTCGFIMLGGQDPHEKDITVVAQKPCSFSWTVSWFEPANAEPLTDHKIGATVEETTEPPQETTESATEAITVPEETASSPTVDAGQAA